MSRLPRIAIVGHGIAGAALAACLAEDGRFALQCFERAPADHRTGAGLLLQPAGQAVLATLGVLARARALGARIDRIHARTEGGRSVLDLHYSHLHAEVSGLGLQRQALLDLLRARAQQAGATVHYGVAIASVDPDRGVLLDAAARAHGRFDLVVGADGWRSATRRASRGSAVLRPYGWGARLCLLDDPHGHIGPTLRQVYAGDRELAYWPVGRQSPGAPRRVQLSWRLLPGEAALVGESGASWQAGLRSMAPELAPLLATAALSSHVDVRYGALSRPAWGTGRVVLLGDAAHAMSPQLGHGASLALRDAWTLAEHLRAQSDDLPSAVRRYIAARDAVTRTQLQRSRWLTPLYQSPSRPWRWLRERLVPALARRPWFARRMLGALAATHDPA